LVRLALVVAVLVAPRCALAQIVLTPADTARVWTVSLEKHISTAIHLKATGRIWLRGWTERGVRHALSDGVVAGLRSTFPLAQQTDLERGLYECPPGRELRMPGSGCPIRERGIIVTFHDLEIVDAERVKTSVSVIRSTSNGASTSMRTLGLLLRRDSEDWVVEKVLFVGVT